MNTVHEFKILLDEMIEMQKKKLWACARRIIPHVIPDDLLQPNDFPALENHPEFRYEEGILSGLLSIQSTLQALQKGNKFSLDG